MPQRLQLAPGGVPADAIYVGYRSQFANRWEKLFGRTVRARNAYGLWLDAGMRDKHPDLVPPQLVPWIPKGAFLARKLPALRGLNLVCECKNDDGLCHANVLIQLANRPEPQLKINSVENAE